MATEYKTPHHENECGATAINAVLVRCMQNGRAFFTSEDYRAAQIILKTLGALDVCDDAQKLSAPQTLGKLSQVAAYSAVEGALAEGWGGVVKTQKDSEPKDAEKPSTEGETVTYVATEEEKSRHSPLIFTGAQGGGYLQDAGAPPEIPPGYGESRIAGHGEPIPMKRSKVQEAMANVDAAAEEVIHHGRGTRPEGETIEDATAAAAKA